MRQWLRCGSRSGRGPGEGGPVRDRFGASGPGRVVLCRSRAARQMESWLSGRKHHPAKVESLELGTVGSNPTGSAFFARPPRLSGIRGSPGVLSMHEVQRPHGLSSPASAQRLRGMSSATTTLTMTCRAGGEPHAGPVGGGAEREVDGRGHMEAAVDADRGPRRAAGDREEPGADQEPERDREVEHALEDCPGIHVGMRSSFQAMEHLGTSAPVTRSRDARLIPR